LPPYGHVATWSVVAFVETKLLDSINNDLSREHGPTLVKELTPLHAKFIKGANYPKNAADRVKVNRWALVRLSMEAQSHDVEYWYDLVITKCKLSRLTK
jgi:hypothetical protein